MRPNNCQVIPATIANAAINSSVVWADDIVRASFQAIVAGTVNGAIQVQVSNEQAVGLPANQYQPANWTNLGTTVALTSAGSYFVPLFESCYEYIRVVYSDSSGGTATGSVAVRMKSLGL